MLCFEMVMLRLRMRSGFENGWLVSSNGPRLNPVADRSEGLNHCLFMFHKVLIVK